MESIKVYFQNALIGLATLILVSLQTNTPQPQTPAGQIDNSEDDNDVHMFI
jgi:hypothetical protein